MPIPSEIQAASSRIWTQASNSIFYDNNSYAKCALYLWLGDAYGVMVIIQGNGHSNLSSNPG